MNKTVFYNQNANMDTCQYTLSVEIPYNLTIVSSPNYDHDYCFKIGKTIISGKDIVYHDNGNKKYEYNYKNCKRDGLSTTWYENGNKECECYSKNGKLDGLVVGWRYDGTKWYEDKYKDGELDGISTVWHKYGIKTYERGYRGITLVYEEWHE